MFGCDTMLNASFEADWQFIKQRKQKLIAQNNIRENKTRVAHTYNVGDNAVIKAGVQRKHGENPCVGPYRVTHVCDNGTVRLEKVANNNGGACLRDVEHSEYRTAQGLINLVMLVYVHLQM